MTISVEMSEAARRLRTARRVLVIGCSGSGKSTLAKALAAHLALPCISMDREIFWLPGWRQRPREDALRRLRGIVEGERWIMDGTSPGTLPLRLARADIVIWLRPPRRASLYGVITRWLRYRGRSRPEMADGCPERIDWEFLTYVWNFEKNESPEIEAKLAEFGAHVPVLVLKSNAGINRTLALLGADH